LNGHTQVIHEVAHGVGEVGVVAFRFEGVFEVGLGEEEVC
jgi:hypothetical protein